MKVLLSWLRDYVDIDCGADEVAEILGIDQQEVENAFIQAQNEFFNSGSFAPREDWSSDNLPPDRVPPEGFPEGMEPSERLPEGMTPTVGGSLPEPILTRMAEILNIDQQTLEDAIAQVQSTDGAQ